MTQPGPNNKREKNTSLNKDKIPSTTRRVSASSLFFYYRWRTLLPYFYTVNFSFVIFTAVTIIALATREKKRAPKS